MEIVIEAGHLEVEAELFDTATARAIFEALPLEAAAHTWGDEVYFEIPVTAELDETAREVVQIGDLGYWPTGKAMCIFFGPTPISSPGEIKPASAVNIIGQVRGEAAVFKEVQAGARIKVGRA
ncbi:MAG: hypothetical protein JRI95_12870 [Deltaproteobacteria bacterium]|nr:hypothetical protein [Deltaproteobacteria bacterium]MBW2084893.1 hypothetical protein [Deltaproteobacteria bacterium]